MKRILTFASRYRFFLLALCLCGYFLSPILFDENRSASPEQWHCRIDGPFGDPSTTIRSTDTLKVIELTNSGEFVERCQLSDGSL
jgi:hypothetical protein